MKFNFFLNDKEAIERLFETNYKNQLIGEFYMDLIDNYSNAVNPFDFNNLLKEMDLDEDDYFKSLIKEYKIDNIKKLDVDDYLNSPYYDYINIKSSSTKINNYEIKYKTIKPYELFLYKDISFDKLFKEITSIGYFTKPYKFLNVIKDNTVWMSLHPHEINSMKRSLGRADGDVLVLGLGLGYFPILLDYYNDISDKITSITIIEKDPNIITLFNSLLDDSKKRKFKIIQDDAFHYLEDHFEEYETIFVDLYHNAIDGLPIYLKIKEFEDEDYIDTKYLYWIEDTILAYFRRIVISIIQNEYEGIAVNYDEIEDENKELISFIYSKIKNLQFNSYKQIEDLLYNNLSDVNFLSRLGFFKH